MTLASMRWFAEAYLRGPQDVDDWRASPLRAPDLSGLPPAYVLTAGCDPLGDEGAGYARRLEKTGVAVDHRHLADQTHGFLLMGKIFRAAGPALDEIAAALKRAFGVELKEVRRRHSRCHSDAVADDPRQWLRLMLVGSAPRSCRSTPQSISVFPTSPPALACRSAEHPVGRHLLCPDLCQSDAGLWPGR